MAVPALAAVTDCKGTGDGTYHCIVPTYGPTSYSACVQTGNGMQDLALANCRISMFPNGMHSEADAIAVTSCAFPPGVSGISWLGVGQSHYDAACYSGTVEYVNGVELRGFGTGALGGPFNLTMVYERDTAASCPAHYTNIGQMVNGVYALSACKSVCPPDAPWNDSENACVITKKVSKGAKDKSGSMCPVKGAENPPIANPIYPLTGAKREAVATGVSIGGTALILTYDTARQLLGTTQDDAESFGTLWYSSLHRKFTISSDSAFIKLYRGNGYTIDFALVGGIWVADADVNDKLESLSGYFRYTNAATQTIEYYLSNGQLTSLEKPVGSPLSFKYSDSTTAAGVAPAPGYLIQVTDNTGRSIKFEYTLPAGGAAYRDGRISKITDTYGRATTTAYDANHNLSAITWADGRTRNYLYENAALPWALTGVSDERGIRYSTFGYDTAGRAISSEHAGGVESFTVSYGSPPQVAITEVMDSVAKIMYRYYDWQLPVNPVVTKPNGQAIVMTPTSILGTPFLTGTSQPAGSGCAASNSFSTFDANGNLLSQDDFQGQRSCFAYDSRNRETVRVEGLANTVDCSTVIGSSATLPAGSRKVKTQWHVDWRLPTKVTQPGVVSSTVYQGQADGFNNNAIANCTPSTGMTNGKAMPIVCRQVDQAISGTPVDPASIDPYIDSVGLLMHGDGPNNSTGIADSSVSVKPISLIGTSRISTVNSKLGGSSIRLDTGSYMKVANSSDFDFGMGDFTVEFWVNFENPTYANQVIGFRPDSFTNVVQASWYMQTSGSHLQFYVADPSSGYAGSAGGTGTLVSGAWNHVAITRNGGVFRTFLNGSLDLTFTTAKAMNFNTSMLLNIGRAFDGNFYGGYFDEVRVTKGVARYTAAFTPPVVATGAGVLLDAAVADRVTQFTYDDKGRVLTILDPLNRTTNYGYYVDTVFDGTSINPEGDLAVGVLLHADGTDGSSVFIDSSTTPKTVTSIGTPKISATTSRFGGSSVRFDGASSWLTLPNSLDFDFGAGDFTIEFWLNLDNSGYSASVLSLRPEGTLGGVVAGSWYLLLNGGHLQFAVAHPSSGWAGITQSNAVLSSGAWNHVAIARSSGIQRMFINGVPDGSMATGLPFNFNSSMKLHVGRSYDAGMLGYIDELRLTKGVARYTSQFTPPTAAFVAPAVAASNPIVAPTAIGHTKGDLQSITNPAGHVTQFTQYDKAGRIRQTVDPKGVVTDITYTPRGWVSSVTETPPGAPARTTSYTHDDAGQLTGVSQPDGTSLAYSYDAAHRLIGATDAKGNSVAYTLDNMGNRIAEEVRDPGNTLQRAISRSFDALNRLQQVSGAAQ